MRARTLFLCKSVIFKKSTTNPVPPLEPQGQKTRFYAQNTPSRRGFKTNGKSPFLGFFRVFFKNSALLHLVDKEGPKSLPRP
jgi:hypothetical protein